MHRTTFTYLLTLTLFSTAHCQTAAEARLSGVLTPSDAYRNVVYLVAPQRFEDIAANYMGRVIDSAEVAADGHFAFRPILLAEKKQLFQLIVQKKGTKFPTQLNDTNPATANYLPIVLHAGSALNVNARMDALQATARLEPRSPDNLQLSALRQLRQTAYEAQRPLLERPAHDETMLMAHEQALAAFRAPLIHFADTTHAVLPALCALRWISPEGDYERVPEVLYRQCQKWGAAPDAPALVQSLCEKAKQDQLPAMIGALIPNEALPGISGDTVFLHDLLKSHRLTLLDIWASWCFPCRKENKEVLAPLAAQYRDKGFQIIAYSIDASAPAWKAAVEKDGARWGHYSHLSGDATPFMEALRISTIPANFLLDNEGRIVAKNLHGDALRAFLVDFLEN